MATVYVEVEQVDHIRLNNDTGDDLDQYDITVIGDYVCIADEDIDDGDVGSFHVEDGIILQAGDDEFTDQEETFATVNQIVYFDSATGLLSDTSTSGYYAIGQLVEIRNSEGVIRFSKFRYAQLIA